MIPMQQNVRKRYTPFFFFSLLSALVIFIFSCSKEDDTSSPLVINEFMSSNSETASDQDGEYDDWIELYNNSTTEVDLSGYYLSDNNNKITKWQFPDNTVIAGNGYLIVWADSDTLQDGLHANFKLSADGEEVVLARPNQDIIDYVKFGSQTLELSYSRIPNGTGSFSWQTPTFNSENVQVLKK